MGRVQETSNMKMWGGQVRHQSDGDGAPLSSKRHKTHENEKKASKESGPAGGRAEPVPTPVKDRKAWSQKEETDLVKVLLEHRRAGKMISSQSMTAPYWTDLISLLYPGEKGVTQRRLYDKVRRMHHRYHEIVEKKTPYKNTHEKSLFVFWEKIFVGEINTKKAVLETETEKVPNGNSIKLVEVSDSSEEEEEEERVPTAKDTSKAGPSAQESSESEVEDEDDEEVDEDDDENGTSPENGRPVPSGRNVTRAEVTRATQEELRKTAFRPTEENPKAASKLGFKQSKGSENENFATERLPNVQNGGKRSKGVAEQARLEVDIIRSLKAELFEYVRNLRNDCIRELDEVRGQLISPARLELARRQQELVLEEVSLQEKEFEISQRFCRLQKEALKLRSAS